jgi:phosphoribosylaminoimidazole-succinocarboxamide synthase
LFTKFSDVENHILETDVARFPEGLRGDAPLLEGRSVIVRKAEVIPFECVARGYVAGSGWSDYRKTGSVCGVPLPAGLREAERLSEPIFTPATKNPKGHDENVPFERIVHEIGSDAAGRLRDLTISLYERAAAHALSKGLILADTKLEFGWYEERIIWLDEAFTPDSSRYWDAGLYAPGKSPASFDKQFVRDWLDSTGWDHRPPAPRLPEGVVRTTREKYLEAFRLLTGSYPSLTT